MGPWIIPFSSTKKILSMSAVRFVEYEKSAFR